MLPLRKESVIASMRADPEPYDFIPFSNADSSIIFTDANGVDWLYGVHGLETETWMIRVLLEESVRPTGLALHMRREFCEGLPEARRLCARSQFVRIELLGPTSTMILPRLFSKLTE